ncbi:L-aspartate oxidase [Homoserinibacter sp. GY 40078]|uniref:L-aspartate oxidase n=1 Tax=Homoserinibacter sp. GY 40078 TaxID=2603275 RepID=UPI0011C96E96|nr:L-aspartate oxidase [Homoserinibacter sp. GY 40078]TXK17357.1 L-aspartate oxidase [Homoserinibacter sp. GY 40078]
MRVVVVGSGIAGLVAALRASERHEVVLVTKGALTDSNTRYAQGGIAAAMFPDDSVESHVADTLRAGAGLSDPAAVQVLCSEGPARIRDLLRWGVEFDLDADGRLARGHEAAHSARRVLHAGGDGTGLAIELALVAELRRRSLVIREHTFLRDVLRSREASGAPVVGVEVVTPAGTTERLDADAVILATGGAGMLYARTTNPEGATGDGVAAAWRAGAVLADVEFVQFHPTALAVPGGVLISEAVRGEGAVLLDAAGRRFLREVHPDAELAPRDVVARGIADAVARQAGAPVLLDATALERDRGHGFLAARFPGITSATLAHGFDWTTEPIPVAPAAHYWMGGIRTDLHGRSSVPGLFAVGEAARTGVHGANRLASNSLLEALVFAWRAADALETAWPIPGEGVGGDATVVRVPPATRLRAAHAIPADRDHLRHLMQDSVGLRRDAGGLIGALAVLESWEASTDSVAGLEDRNLLDLARVVTRAALAREESRGAHARDDAADARPELAHPIAWRLAVAPRAEEARR